MQKKRPWDDLKPGEQYCPICERVVHAMNKEEVKKGIDIGYIYVHDDIIHTQDEVNALRYGVQ